MLNGIPGFISIVSADTNLCDFVSRRYYGVPHKACVSLCECQYHSDLAWNELERKIDMKLWIECFLHLSKRYLAAWIWVFCLTAYGIYVMNFFECTYNFLIKISTSWHNLLIGFIEAFLNRCIFLASFLEARLINTHIFAKINDLRMPDFENDHNVNSFAAQLLSFNSKTSWTYVGRLGCAMMNADEWLFGKFMLLSVFNYI